MIVLVFAGASTAQRSAEIVTVDAPAPRLFSGTLPSTALAGIETERLFLARDSENVLSPLVAHQRGREVFLHGLLDKRSRGGTVRFERSPADFEVLPMRVEREGRGGVVLVGASRRLRLNPDGTLVYGAFEIRLSGSVGTAPWESTHDCSLTKEFLRRESSVHGSDSLSRRVLVSVHQGHEGFSFATVLRATESTVLANGEFLLVQSEDRMSLRLGGVVFEPFEDAERSFEWTPRGYAEDGEVAKGTEGDGVSIVGRDELQLGLRGGVGPGLLHVVLGANGGAVQVEVHSVSDRLDSGEGRWARWQLAVNAEPLGAPALLQGQGVLAKASAASSSPIARAAKEELARFLEDPRLGLHKRGAYAGDWQMDRERVGNLEYDTIDAMLNGASLLATPQALSVALAMGDHLLSIDHDATGTGLFFQHGVSHRDGKVELGHHWVGGLCRLHRIDEDTLRREDLLGVLKAQVRHFRSVDLALEFPRSLGWGLQALVDGARHARPEEDVKREIKRFREHLRRAQGEDGLWRLTRDEEGFNESPFVLGGIILPALADADRLCPEGANPQSISRAVDGLLSIPHRTEEGWRLPERILLSERRGLSGRSGVAPGEEIALFVRGLTRARPSVAKSPSLLALKETIVPMLRAPRKRFIGREVTLILRSLPELLE